MWGPDWVDERGALFINDRVHANIQRDGTFSVVPARMKQAVTSLTKQLMELQGRGDREAAEALLAKQGVVRPPVRRVLERLKDVPVDIAPRYITAEELVRDVKK